MSEYFYRASDKKGRISRGVIQAININDLELKLSRMGLWLIDSRISINKRKFFKRRNFPRKLLILFCIHMEHMLKAGAAIPEALNEIRLSIPNQRFRDVVAAMTEDIQGGKGLSESMRPYPEVFPPIFSGLIQVGERAGKLQNIFKALADTIKWEDELVSRAVRAVRYPLIVAIIVLGLFFFLMIFIGPKLVDFIPKMGGRIPLYTMILFSTSRFMVRWWWLMMLIPPGLVMGITALRRVSPKLNVLVDHLLLRIWFFGPLMKNLFLVRFSTHFTLMYRSGIPILDALEINADLTDNKFLFDAIHRVRNRVAEGQPVSSALRDEALLPPPLPRLVEAGEASGQLDGAMENVSYFLDREVRETIDNLQSMIEPALTILMGILLGWVILSVFGPIYETISHVKF